MSLISLEGMEFFAYHGCYREEQVVGTKFIVDLYIEADLSKSEKSDNLSDTTNYQEVYLLVKKEMETNSFLLEHIGRRILNSVKEHFPEILKVKIKVSKMNPQLGGKIKNVSISL
jgi:7,8-dihydroneopterin aldolase/epimerase/oxygenase